MAELSQQQKKDYAKSLFLHENLTQQEIADRVGVTRRSITRWKEDGKWDDLKVSITITKEEQLKNLYNQLKAINEEIAGRKEKRFATSAEADIITKLANAIEKMEGDIGVSDMISASKKFLTWIRKSDLAKAQELTPLFDAFIKDCIR